MRRFIGYEKGINFGGWLSQCDYTENHLETFITEKDFETVKNWGVDHIRIPVDYNIFRDEKDDTVVNGFKYVDKALEWGEKYKLNIILDLHKTAGFFFDKAHNESGFFANEKLQERFFDLWKEFSERYGKIGDRIAFELLNEVTEPSYKTVWNEIAAKAVSVIRKNAPENRIIIGSYWNNSIDALKDLDMPKDDGIVYTYHCYDPFIFTHQSAYWVDGMPEDFRISYPSEVSLYREKTKELGFDYIQDYREVQEKTFTPSYFEGRFVNAVKLCEERNVPLYCGEYGVIKLADSKSILNWYKDINSAFRRFSIARAAWSYKEVDYGLCDGELKSVITELIDCL